MKIHWVALTAYWRRQKQQRTWRWMKKNFSRIDRKILGKTNSVSVTHEYIEQYQVIYHTHYLSLLRRRERKWGRKNIWISKHIWKFPMCGEKNQPTDPKSWAKLKKEILKKKDILGTSSEKATAPNSSTLAWKIPWTEEPGGLPSMGLLRVGHDWATSLSLLTFMHWRRKWQPTLVFLPGESQGRGSLVGCRLWGRAESDTTEAT